MAEFKMAEFDATHRNTQGDDDSELDYHAE